MEDAQCQFFRETYVFETAILTKVANFDFDSIEYLLLLRYFIGTKIQEN